MTPAPPRRGWRRRSRIAGSSLDNNCPVHYRNCTEDRIKLERDNTMRKKVLAVVFAAALLVGMAVTLFGVGTAQANDKKFDVFDMNDRLATETGASGFGKIRLTQEDSIVLDRLHVKNLQPRHDFEVVVTVGAPGDLTFTPVNIITSGPITTNADGHLKIQNLDAGSFAPGDYRVDIFVVHPHGGEPLTRDLLLACHPFPVVTVE